MILITEVIRVIYAVDGLVNGLIYIPQMRKSWKDPSGTSILSWGYWSFGSLDSLLYAILVAKNLELSAIMALNVIGCTTVLIITILKRKKA